MPSAHVSQLAVVLGLAAATSCQPPSLRPVEVGAVQLSATTVEFEPTYVGGRRLATLHATNPNRVSVDVALSAGAPFVASHLALRLAPGEAVSIEMSFEPSAVGAVVGELRIGEVRVRLSGVGLEPLTCPAPDTCALVRFEPEQGACVRSRAPNGQPCNAPFACFAAASCLDGRCVGQATSCDDHDPCTQDVCGATGCRAFDASDRCPQPSDPCRVAVCRRDRGCSSEPAIDGTPCGPSSCDEARICVAGACVTRAPPTSQACSEVVVGVPGGAGLRDGIGAQARLRLWSTLTASSAGDVWLYDTESAVVRRWTVDAGLRTIAGSGQRRLTDGTGAAAEFTAESTAAALDSQGNLWLADSRGGCGVLRRVTPRGQTATVVGLAADGGCASEGGPGEVPLSRVQWLLAAPDGGFLLGDGHGLRRVGELGEVSTVFDWARVLPRFWGSFPVPRLLTLRGEVGDFYSHDRYLEEALYGHLWLDGGLTLEPRPPTPSPFVWPGLNGRVWWYYGAHPSPFNMPFWDRLPVPAEWVPRLSVASVVEVAPLRFVLLGAVDGQGAYLFELDAPLGQLTKLAGPELPEPPRVGLRGETRFEAPTELRASDAGLVIVDWTDAGAQLVAVGPHDATALPGSYTGSHGYPTVLAGNRRRTYALDHRPGGAQVVEVHGRQLVDTGLAIPTADLAELLEFYVDGDRLLEHHLSGRNVTRLRDGGARPTCSDGGALTGMVDGPDGGLWADTFLGIGRFDPDCRVLETRARRRALADFDSDGFLWSVQEQTLLRAAPDGGEELVATLSDVPIALAVESPTSALVLVPRAVVRIRRAP